MVQRKEDTGNMYCRYCGKEISEDTNFCPHCGKQQFSDSNEKDKTSIEGSIEIRHKINTVKVPRNVIDSIIKWLARTCKFVGLLLFLYLIVATLSWGYLGNKSSKWSADDKEKVSMATQNPSIADSISKELLYEDHCSYDLFGMVHECDEYSSYENGMHHKAIVLTILEASARRGNVNSMLMLGRYYKYHSFKPYLELVDDKSDLYIIGNNTSTFWFQSAAQKDNAEAEGELGHSYKYGFGVKQDFQKAYNLLKKGADDGDAISQWRFANLCCVGVEVYWKCFSDRACTTWFNCGNRFYSVGDYNESVTNEQTIKKMLNSGPSKTIIPRDIDKARKYWKMAADQGLKVAQQCLEKVYE